MDISEKKALVVLLFGKSLFNIPSLVLGGAVRLCTSLSPLLSHRPHTIIYAGHFISQGKVSHPPASDGALLSLSACANAEHGPTVGYAG